MRLATLVLGGILLLGCSGSGVPPDKQDYVGAWVAPNMRLSIEPGGGVSYERQEGGSRTEVNAPIKGFSGDDFEVGVWIFTTDFQVSAPPHLAEDGRWHMTVDGVDLVRVN